MKKRWKAIFSWVFALILALACANLVSYFYRSGAGSILRENAFSSSIRTPNSRMVRGSEGYGINHVDENGYLNASNLPLNDGYILLMGSSHAEGLQVMQRDNMASVLDDMLAQDGRTVYNLGTAGYTLPLIIKGFQAALSEFPDSSAILIEISQLSFPRSELKDALHQTEFSRESTGQALVQSQSLSRQIRNAVLEAAPIISLLRAQFETLQYGFDGAFGIDPAWFDQQPDAAQGDTTDNAQTSTAPVESAVTKPAEQEETFSDMLNEALALLRAEYDRPIILLYHPALRIQGNGVMKIRREEGPYEAYLNACENNDIVFVDTGDAFLAAYEADFVVPYGFSNTTFGSGHLNTQGHKIVAEEFYRALTELSGKGND